MHKNDEKLSLLSVIFININIMVGAGLFINTTNLVKMAGAAGFVSYALLAILIYPLIASIAQLVKLFPDGGFYIYAKQLSPTIGFISAWSYFVGKLASALILMHSSILLLQQIIPLLAKTNIYLLDLIVLAIYFYLNLFHLKAGASIQLFFLMLKCIPILFVLLSSLYLFNPGNYVAEQFVWGGILDTLPFVLYAAVGFEAITSISDKIKDAHKNAPRAMLISYLIVMCINVIYQFCFYGSVGTELATAPSFLSAFPLLITRLFSDASTQQLTQTICNIAIACSALGAAYGILFSNSWNLHTLAKHNLIMKPTLFLKRNRYEIPYWCIIAEIVICVLYLCTTGGAQIPLQQIAVFACTISYTLSIFALLLIACKKQMSPCIPMLGLMNCCIFLIACIYSFFAKGSYSLLVFGSMMLAGLIMYAVQKRTTNTKDITPVRP